MQQTEAPSHKPYLTRLFAYVQFVSLPLLLALVFVIQNYFFNRWLNLDPGNYLGRFLAVTFGLGLIIYSPCLFFRNRGRYIYLSVATLFVCAVFTSQFFYFSYAKDFLQVSALRYINQTASVTGTIKGLFSYEILFFLAGFLVLAGAGWWSKKSSEPQVVLHWREKVVLFLIMLLVASLGYYFLVAKEEKDWGNASMLYKDVYDMNTLVRKIGIVNFFFEDAVKYISHRNLVDAEDQQFLASVAKQQTVPATGGNDFGIAKGRNVIFIQVESLESALINQTIGGQEITPNLNRLARQGMYFSNYYTQIGPGNTADAEFSTLNSMYPLPDDVAFVDYPHNDYQALPATLVKNGYSTYGMHADVPTFWNRANIYPNLGFQQQIGKSAYVKSRSIGKGPSDVGDEDFLMQSLTKLQTFKQPFFSVLITISSHTPFELPQDLQALTIPSDTNLSYTQQQYLESVHYTDKAIGEFMDKLQQDPIYKNSLVFIYGDHGSFTGISNALGNANPLVGLQNSGVPLIMLAPGTNLTGVNPIPASHIDLYPTILNLLGIKPKAGLMGQDLFNTKTPVMTHRNIFSGSINTIVTPQLAYQAADDDKFQDGQCFSLPAMTAVAVDECKEIYQQQSNLVQASDIIVRGNLLKSYLAGIKR